MSKMVSNFAEKMLQVRMYSNFLTRLCLIVIVIQVVVIIAYNVWFNPLWEATKQMYSSGMEMTWDLCEQFKFVPAFKIFGNSCSGLLSLQSSALIKSFWVWVIIPLIMLYMFLFDEAENKDREFIQGKRYIIPEQLNKLAHSFTKLTLLQTLKLKKCIPFGQVHLPISEEVKQTFIVGKPGVGKTNLFNFIIKRIRSRAQKLIIHDYKGDYVEKFYEPNKGDILFNPLDMRSVGWCLFNDCKSVMDIEAFAYGLIPEAMPGSEPFWNNAAREILVGILRYCYANGKTTNRDIWETVILPNKTLYNILVSTKGGEAGAKHLADPDGRTAGSIVSNLMQYVKVFEYMSSNKDDFSITDWLTNKDRSGTIFITNYANLQNTLKPMISLFIQTVGRVLLSQRDNRNNRLFFFLDEFGQLPNMNTIQNLMTASRSKGGSVFIGVQDIGQIDKLYGKDSRTTILNSASNRVIFNCKDYNTAKFLSADIGETEYYEHTSTKSLSMGKGDRLNTSKQRRKEFLVTPEDIQSLSDLRAFVSIGHHDITLSKWKFLKLKSKNEAFIQRPDLDLSNIVDISASFILSESELVNQAEVTNHDYGDNYKHETREESII